MRRLSPMSCRFCGFMAIPHNRLPKPASPVLFRHLLAVLILSFFLMPFIATAQATAPAPSANTRRPLSILNINPSGDDVPMGRQVVFAFDRPVVPIGRMERDASEIPITIEPALACKWRWLNPSTLACQLDEKDAPASATRYRITVRPGITTEDGATLAKEVVHSFITQRPRLSDTDFSRWLSPEKPLLTVRFNQPVQEASVAAHLFFQSPSDPRVPVDVTAVPPDRRSQSTPDGVLWDVGPKTDLPPDSAVTLMAEPGVLSLDGPEAGTAMETALEFHTFPAFSYLGLECSARGDKKIFIPPAAAQGTRTSQRCTPTSGVSLQFSAPLPSEQLKQGLQVTPPPGWTTSEEWDPWEDVFSDSSLEERHAARKTYEVHLPWGFVKPFTDYRIEAAADAIRDAFGRPLAAPIHLAFATDHLEPELEMISTTPVLEKGLETDARVWAVNLDEVKITYSTVTPPASGAKETREPSGKRTKALAVPKKMDVPHALPLGIRSLLGKPSGVVQGRITTTPPTNKPADEEETGGRNDLQTFFAQVTPFQVHAKIGHHSSLAWVTDFSTGQPVAGVQVQIVKCPPRAFALNAPALSQGTTGQDGLATLAGTATLDPELKWLNAYDPEGFSFFLVCRKGEDMAVLPLDYDFRVAVEGSNREYIPDWLRPLHGHVRAWGATAQGIYKAGDTVQFKIYVRSQDNRRFVAPPLSGYGLKVVDPMDKVVFERDNVQLSRFGAFDGEFRIPANGAVGWYRFVLTPSFISQELEPLRVLVSDFTPAPFKVTTTLNATRFRLGETVTTTTTAALHAGGPYTDAATRVVATLVATPFTSSHLNARDFRFGVLGISEYTTPDSQNISFTSGKLDNQGLAEATFTIPDTPVQYGSLRVESTVQDERGKSVAATASAEFTGRDRYVGLLQNDWVLAEGRPAVTRVIVVDEGGAPVAGVPVHVTVQWKEVKAARVKGAGDAFITEYEENWIEETAADLTSADDAVEFPFTPKHAGEIRITARIEDTQKRPHETILERWASGRGYVVWKSEEGNLLNVRPEKEEVSVGETARFLVQNPFPGAEALITVERFGVLTSWVKKLETSSEIIEIPVLPDYLPGFYLSVMVAAPRVDKPVSPEGEDLGKPAFRMGYVQMPVIDPYKEVAVTMHTDKEVYKPRETVTVEIEAKPRHQEVGAPLPPMELAVSVLDESVFALLQAGRAAFDPYRGFYKLDDLDLANYNLVMRLVGREKLERKGANPGGGGGPDLSLRSLFKFVSYWNPSVFADAQGKARIQFQVPDNLTGWRILVMAVTPEDRMGLGESVFKVNQSTEIRPVLPNQVMEGDRFDAGFSVMNRTETPRTLDVTIQAEGPVRAPGEQAAAGDKTGAAASKSTVSLTQKVTAEPFKRTILRLPLQTTEPGRINFTVRAGDEKDQDGLQQTLRIYRRESLQVAAAYGSLTEGEAVESIAFPQNMRTDVGRVGVELSPTVIGNVEGAFGYMRDYPFGCWEQKLTKGVMASFYGKLKTLMPKNFVWQESTTLPAKTLELSADYQAPGGGMTYYVPKDEYADPYLSAFTALAFTWLRENGLTPPAAVEEKLHAYLDKMLRQDVLPSYYSSGMTVTVRATALAALARAGKADRALVERFAAHVPAMSLFGKALYLQALTRVNGTERLRRDTLQKILAHADQSGGTFTFKESLDAGFQSLLCSAVRDNSAILSALLAYQTAAGPDSTDPALGDIPIRLMRSITLGRKGRHHWASTQENMFAVKAITDYGRVYESKPPAMTAQVFLDEEALGKAKFNTFTAPPTVLTRPLREGDPGRKARAKINRTGQGRLYYGVTLAYSPAELPKERINAGLEVHREFSVERDGRWVMLTDPAIIRTGDLVRVDLFLMLPAERYFVVLEDPVPGGLEPVNRDLATASERDAQMARATPAEGSLWHTQQRWIDYGVSRWSFYHRELGHRFVRFYSERLPAGRYHLSYVAQAVAPGEFAALPTRAEEMYNPDVYGKAAPAQLRVEAAE